MNFKEVRVFLGVISIQVNAELYMFVVQSAPLFYFIKKTQNSSLCSGSAWKHLAITPQLLSSARTKSSFNSTPSDFYDLLHHGLFF